MPAPPRPDARCGVIESDRAYLGHRDAQPVGGSSCTFERLELDPSARDGEERPLDLAAVLEHERVRVAPGSARATAAK